jgi:hypothetical protein
MKDPISIYTDGKYYVIDRLPYYYANFLDAFQRSSTAS